MNHVVFLLLLLGNNNLVAELLVGHADSALAVDFRDLVAVFKTGHSAGRVWLNVLDEIGALVDNVGLVQLEAERVDLRLLGLEDDGVGRATRAGLAAAAVEGVVSGRGLLLLLPVVVVMVVLLVGGCGEGGIVLLEYWR